MYSNSKAVADAAASPGAEAEAVVCIDPFELAHALVHSLPAESLATN
jgi:hypothetical protein